MKAVHTTQQPERKLSTPDDPPQNERSSQEKESKGKAAQDKKTDEKGTDARQTADQKKQDKKSKDEDSETKEPKSSNASKSGNAGASAYTGSVSAIGDSVMLGAVPSLQKDVKGLGVVDAAVGLQVYDAIGILKSRRASGQLGSLVIVHLGNNGTFTRQEFDQIMRILS